MHKLRVNKCLKGETTVEYQACFSELLFSLSDWSSCVGYLGNPKLLFSISIPVRLSDILLVYVILGSFLLPNSTLLSPCQESVSVLRRVEWKWLSSPQWASLFSRTLAPSRTGTSPSISPMLSNKFTLYLLFHLFSAESLIHSNSFYHSL